MAYHISRTSFSASQTGADAHAAVALAGTLRASAWRALALGGLAAFGASLLMAAPASALTMQECSAKYKAAQAAGTLGATKWNDFRKAQCGDGAAAAPAAAQGAAPAANSAANPAANSAASPATGQTAPVRPGQQAAPAQPAAAGSPVFPRAIAPKYSAEKPAKQRMHTCLDQYNANKTTNGNGGLKWIQKGGGYYSECNKRLKS